MQNEFSRIVNEFPSPVWTALPDGQVDFFNQRWCEYTGLSLDEARGTRLGGLKSRWRDTASAGGVSAPRRRCEAESRGHCRRILQRGR